MQLCALDLNERLTFAREARKHQDYFCLECHRSVRLRKGLHRQPHYYHTSPNRECRQDGKGMAHLVTQYFIRDLLPDGEAHLEHRFQSINRVADVAWLPQKLIFEIQYSPITAKEVESRNKDYASLGYQVVWILFDGRYNQKRISSAEDVLKDSPYYFTNMTDGGEGIIYDQLAIVESGKRVDSLPKLEIDISCPEYIKEKLPKLLWRQIKIGALYFKGDCIYNYLQYTQSINQTDFHITFSRLIASQNHSKPTSLSQTIYSYFQSWIVVPYHAVLRLLVERASQ